MMPQLNGLDIEHAERIAVLEAQFKDMHDDIKALKGLLEPMVALYKAGKVVLAISSALLSYTHWDQIIAFLQQVFWPPKH